MSKFEGYKYYLVHFYLEQGTFDVAPKLWLKYNEEKEDFFCQFHTGSDHKLAQRLMKEYKPAPKTWEFYPLKIRGGADTWDLALKRLQKLKSDPYGFSSSDETYTNKQIERLKQILKFKKIPENIGEIKDMFSQVKGPLDQSGTDDKSSSDVQFSSDENYRENESQKKKKRFERKRTRTSASPEISPDRGTKRPKISTKKTVSCPLYPMNYDVDGEKDVPRNKPVDRSETQQKSHHSSRSKSFTLKRGNADVAADDSPVPQSTKKCNKVRKNHQLKQKKYESLPITPINKPFHLKNVTNAQTVPRSKSSINLDEHLLNSQDGADQFDSVLKLLRNLTSAVGQLRRQILQVGEVQEEIKNLLVADNGNRHTAREKGHSQNLEDYHCDNVQKFKELNNKLMDDQGFRETIAAAISNKVNIKNTSLSKIIGNILKPLITKDILERYTARKKTGDKDIFIELPIWSCIKEEIKKEARNSKMAVFKDKELEKGLGGTINNCRSWEKKSEADTENNHGDNELDPDNRERVDRINEEQERSIL